jgi:hypothetical protein
MPPRTPKPAFWLIHEPTGIPRWFDSADYASSRDASTSLTHLLNEKGYRIASPYEARRIERGEVPLPARHQP